MPGLAAAGVDRVDREPGRGAPTTRGGAPTAHARRAGDEREVCEILGWRTSAAAFGPTPVEEAIRRCEQIRDQVRSSPVGVAVTLHPLGLLHAMRGDFALARRLVAEADAILGELGRMDEAVSHHEALVELLARPARRRGGAPASAATPRSSAWGSSRCSR